MAMRRVLIVDDSLDVRRMLAASLRMLGPEFDVMEVPSAEEALLIGSQLPFDLMVADVRLPGMSGLDMLARIRKRSPNLKVILVTGAIDSKTRREVSEAGADAFFYKPVEMADFLDTVERLLGLVKDGFPLPPVAEEPIALPARQFPGLKPEPAAEKPATLADHLSKLRQELKAVSTLLVDDSGHILAEAGELREIHSNQALMTAIMATLSASLKVSHGLGLETPDNLMFFAGTQHHLCLTPVGACALLVVSEDGFRTLQLTTLRAAIHQTAREVGKILANIGVEVEPARETPPPAPEVVEAPLDPSVLAGLDALFSGSKSVKEQDVDAFWDALSEQSELDGSGNADALTYEQAKRLGIAPEDET
jgi:CheY-like chemotaxis protein